MALVKRLLSFVGFVPFAVPNFLALFLVGVLNFFGFLWRP